MLHTYLKPSPFNVVENFVQSLARFLSHRHCSQDMLVPYEGSSEKQLLSQLKEQHRESCDDVKFLSQRIARLRREEERIQREQMLHAARQEKIDSVREYRLREETEKKNRLEAAEIQSAHMRRRLQEEKDSQRHAVFVAKAKVVVDRRERCAEVKREISRSLGERQKEHEEERSGSARRCQVIREMERSSHTSPRRQVQRDLSAELQRLQQERDENVKAAARLVTEQAQLLHRLRLLKPTEPRPTTGSESTLSKT